MLPIIILFIFFVLDIIMIISFLIPGDERHQVIIGKASNFTLIGTVGVLIINIIENIIKGEKVSANPITYLNTIAMVYFATLIFYKKRYGG